ncbi:MAG: hypothetical protein ACKOXK_05795 [Chakrabartia sp.]
MADPRQKDWWGHPALLLLVVFLAGMPLWHPLVPPLIDLPAHMGRYAVQVDAGHSPLLARWYAFDWHWIGNLGVDLLVQVLAPVFGVEAATKWTVVAIPMLGAAGFLAVAREVHGRIPATAFLALPLLWSYPFLWGFVNFALAMALAFLAFALWLWLGRRGFYRLRFVLFLGVSLLLWTAHIYGWALLCVLVGCVELVRAGLFDQAGVRAIGRAVAHSLCLLPPLVPMLLTFSAGGAGGQPFAHGWFNFAIKARWVESVLRDRWSTFDQLSLILLLLVLFGALGRWAWQWQRPSGLPLALAALVLALFYLLLPHALLGSAYADMRLLPYMLAVAVLAIGPMLSGASPVAVAALAFYGLRLGATTYSMVLYNESYRAEVGAIDHLPAGARVVALVGKPCAPEWAVHRLDHLPSLAIIRRHAFVNDQWQAAGAQLISVRYRATAPFLADPSQFVVEPRCERPERRAFGRAIALIPRDAVDYVWVIQQPDAPADMTGLVPVWRAGRSALYRVVTTG